MLRDKFSQIRNIRAKTHLTKFDYVRFRLKFKL